MEEDKLHINQLKEGGADAFKLIYEKYFHVLYAYAFDILLNKYFAEDVTEEVFLKLWEKRNAINISSSLKSYLFKSVRNACLDFIKLKNVRQNYKEQVMNKCKIEDEYELFDTYNYNTYLTKELGRKIKKEINRLPNDCRKTFKMSRYFRLKNKEIALRRNVSLSTVEKQISKALSILHEKLRDYL